MKFSSFLIFAFVAAIFFSSCKSDRGTAKILVFTKTSGFVHESIPKGVAALQALATANGIEVDTSRNADIFNDSTLKNYSAIVFLNTTGNVLDINQQVAMERYIQAGGGFMGIHSATDTEYDWGWYGGLIGGYFTSHPKVQQATLVVNDRENEATKFLPEKWTRTDEWYNFKKLSKDIKVLISIDEKSYEGGTNGTEHPMSWYHDYDGGRSFYTELGHTDESYTDSLYLKHVLGGIKYAIGKNRELDYSAASSQYPPDEDRFSRVVLSQGGFYEPTELSVLPNLDILVSQRRGEILLYKNDTKQIKQAGFLRVYFKTDTAKGVNAEEGLLGIKADPDFEKNHWIYVVYSPVDTSVNRLSRFTLENDVVDMKSEKIILQFYSQREICCHTGGSVAFGPDRTLFISAGDNSTPFDEPGQRFVNHGFAPLNDMPGHMQYDARRSAANTNDLRGKILRIKIKDDGTYSIPDGNLFAPNTAGTRPEIFVMGNRNPYRISVDPKNGYVYWGEVGPDARADSMETRGPRGYDEFNQAKKAGFFGWPLFVGNNYPYRLYNYANGTSGAAFDPAKPVNNSLNNTGLKDLPAANAPFIWYDYGASNEFPELGSGSRTAMAGPAYYTDMLPKETRYPDYYNKKVFIYEWMRGWIMAVSLNKDGDFDKMEPFMPSTKFSAPIDMELGPDGKLYVLEYGNGWFSKNPDAGLVRIDYTSGNRAPKVTDLKVSKSSGSLPLVVTASVTAKDPENDKLVYHWNFGDGTKKDTDQPTVDHTYTKAGDFAISVEVEDNQKASSKSGTQSLYAGNEAPTVDIAVNGNRSFYFPGRAVEYNVDIKDREDTVEKNTAGRYILADFVDAVDKAAVPMGHLSLSESEKGRNLMMASDCKTCHQISTKSIGPAYELVSAKYRNDPKALGYLTEKIKKGGSGVWGENVMPAHPDIPNGDIQTIVKWIFTLNNQSAKPSLPSKGKIATSAATKGNLYITASYNDMGGTGGAKALTAKKTLTLKNNLLTVRDLRSIEAFRRIDTAGGPFLAFPMGAASFSLGSIDLTGITSFDLAGINAVQPAVEFALEIRLDNINGPVAGKATLSANPGTKTFTVNIPFTGTADGKEHEVFIISRASTGAQGSLRLSTVRVNAK